MYRDGIQFHKPFGLREVLTDKQGIQVLQVGETDELRDVGIIPDSAGPVSMRLPPLLCCYAEQRHVEHIRFGCVDRGNLLPGQFGRYQVLFDSISMDPLIDLCQIAPDIPAKLSVLVILEPCLLYTSPSPRDRG